MSMFHLASFLIGCLTSRRLLVKGDLPIHAVTRDVVGVWQFKVSKSSPHPSSCGSTSPNDNVHNLAQVPEKWLSEEGGGAAEELNIYLSDDSLPVAETRFNLEYLRGENGLPPAPISEILSSFPPTRKDWHILPVYAVAPDGDEKPPRLLGYWTMTFDQGVEVVLIDDSPRRFFAFLEYKRVPGEHCRAGPKQGDSVEGDGSTPCYETNPGKTKVGWANEYKDRNPMYACFYGTKNHGPSDKMPFKRMNMMNEIRATVQTVPRDSEYDHFGLQKLRKTSRMEKSWPMSPNPVPSFLQTAAKLGLHTGLYACPSTLRKEPTSKLPANFSWGDPFSDPLFGSADNEIAINQSMCGSCYVAASAYVLEKRAQIFLQRMLNDADEKIRNLFANGRQLSIQSVLDCCFYNQGCEGGLPYTVGRWATDFGIPSLNYGEYGAKTGICQLPDIKSIAESSPSCEADGPILHGVLSPTAFRGKAQTTQRKLHKVDPPHRLYARNYGYVGGCYECCSEEKMMNEIYHHGPVVVAMDAPRKLFGYRNGVFNHSPTSHNRVCDDPQKGLNGYEFTTHALVVVGWGEEDDGTQYWIVRNSWGPEWGHRGYFKLLRGSNIGAIEAQAVYFDPDPFRGILAEFLEDHSVPDDHVSRFLKTSDWNFSR